MMLMNKFKTDMQCEVVDEGCMNSRCDRSYSVSLVQGI